MQLLCNDTFNKDILLLSLQYLYKLYFNLFFSPREENIQIFLLNSFNIMKKEM